mmetsp:Transcript_37299/g.52654  ORF Transcript_37299/g.52654 Transcript_37299/m.52654 type:complete len:81 (-) Transcript_37299:141-383(-)
MVPGVGIDLVDIDLVDIDVMDIGLVGIGSLMDVCLVVHLIDFHIDHSMYCWWPYLLFVVLFVAIFMRTNSVWVLSRAVLF